MSARARSPAAASSAAHVSLDSAARRSRARLCRARRNAEGFALVVPGRHARLSRRSRPASGVSHRVVVPDRQPRRRSGRGLWRAMDAVSSGDRGGRPATEGWANQQIWMGHAAVTRADTHRFAQTFARGGVGQAGVDAAPFRAWIDDWEMRGLDPVNDTNVAPLRAERHRAPISATRCASTQSARWCCRATAATAASRCASRPRTTTASRIIRRRAASTIDGKPVDVTGQAWLDREWSSQPLASDQSGWDWFSLHLNERRQADAVPDAPDRRHSTTVRATGSRPMAGRTAWYRQISL